MKKTPKAKSSKRNVAVIEIGGDGGGSYTPAPTKPEPKKGKGKTPKAPAPKAPAPATPKPETAARDGFGGRLGTKSSAVNVLVIEAGKDGVTVAEIAPRIPNMSRLDISVQLSWLFIKKQLVTREREGQGFRYWANLSKTAGQSAGKPAVGDRKPVPAVRLAKTTGGSV